MVIGRLQQDGAHVVILEHLELATVGALTGKLITRFIEGHVFPQSLNVNLYIYFLIELVFYFKFCRTISCRAAVDTHVSTLFHDHTSYPTTPTCNTLCGLIISSRTLAELGARCMKTNVAQQAFRHCREASNSTKRSHACENMGSG